MTINPPTDEEKWAAYRQMSEDVAAAATDEQRERCKGEAQRIAQVFREASKTDLDAAETVASFSRLIAVMSVEPLQYVSDMLDLYIITYALAAGIIAEEVNPQPDVVIDPAEFPGAYL